MKVTVEGGFLVTACVLAVALGGSAGFSFGAQVHKCKNSEGATVYQEAPCANTGSAGGKVDVRDPAGPGKGDTKAKPADGTGKSMNEAYQRRMEARDYQGALAFATTDQQKAKARKAIADKDTKCANLSIRVQKTQADFKQRGERSKAAADAAQAEYTLNCR